VASPTLPPWRPVARCRVAAAFPEARLGAACPAVGPSSKQAGWIGRGPWAAEETQVAGRPEETQAASLRAETRLLEDIQAACLAVENQAACLALVESQEASLALAGTPEEVLWVGSRP
jgi:hypothetical protein